MAPYAIKRGGKLTGQFGIDVRTKTERFRETFDSYKEADDYEKFVRATGHAPPWAKGAAPAGPTFSEAAEACKAHGGPHGKWKRGRDHSVAQRLDYICRTIGDVAVADVTTETFDALVESLEDRPGNRGVLKASTVNNYLVAASAVLTYAKDRPKKFPGVSRPRIPWLPKDQHKIVWYTEAQEDAVCRVLTEAGHSNVALCVRVLAATGLRVGELLALEPADVEDEWLRLWKTKTNRPRSVPIPTYLARELRALIGSGNVPNKHAIYDRVVAAVGKCGYSPELNVHALRHTTATRLIRQGVNPVIVQKWLGHNNIQTTMRYAHVQDEQLLEAAKKLLPTARANSEHQENIAPFERKKA